MMAQEQIHFVLFRPIENGVVAVVGFDQSGEERIEYFCKSYAAASALLRDVFFSKPQKPE